MPFATKKRGFFSPWALGLLLLALTHSSMLPLAWGQSPGEEDPFPIKRIVIPRQRLPIELEQIRQGVLVQMPRAEFEAKVQKASQAAKVMQNPPRLVRANYTAELEGNALVRGSGWWRVLNPSGQTAVLPISDLNLALEEIRTAAGQAAVLGEFDGKRLGLLIEGEGSQTFHLDWTLRGVVGSSGLFFEMHVPAAPVAQLEIKLPADRVVVMPKSVGLLSGPHQADNPKQRLWRLLFTGRKQVEFLIRQEPAKASQAPLLLAQLQSRQQLLPDRLLADFEYQVDALQQGVRELVFDCDPTLQPYEVTLRGADWKGWQFQEAAPQEKLAGKTKAVPPTGTLRLQLGESFLGTLSGLRIRCLAPVPKNGVWTSPAMRLRQAVLRGETLKVILHPDVFLEKWDAGSFRLSSTGTESDGSQVLSLVDLGASVPQSRRPTGVCKTVGADWNLQQRTWWQLGDQETTLTCDVTVHVLRGRMAQLVLKLPRPVKTWLVENVESFAAPALRSWTAGGGLLVIEPAGPLTSQSAFQVRVRLRAPVKLLQPTAGKLVDFCALEPLEFCLREHIFAISIDPHFQAQAAQAPSPLEVLEKDGPWGSSPISFAYRYRNQAVTGKLRLVPRRARLHSRQVSEITVAPGPSAVLQTRLELEALAGSPDLIDLLISAPSKGRWQARLANNQVVSLERAQVLETLTWMLPWGAPTPLAKASVAVFPLGQRWRLQLAKPLLQRDILTLTTHLDPVARADTHLWRVPFITVLNAESQHREAAVHLIGSELVEVRGNGIVENPAALPFSPQARALNGKPEGRTPTLGNQRFYRLDCSAGGPFSFLELRTRPLANQRDRREICDYGELVTLLQPQGQVVHLFRFQIRDWLQGELPLLLPHQTQKVVAAKVNGQWLNQVQHQQTPDGILVRLPLAMNSTRQQCELLYLTEPLSSGWLPWMKLTAPAPKLPVPPQTFRRLWRVPADFQPLDWDVHSAPPASVDRPAFEVLQTALKDTWHVGEALLPQSLSGGTEEWAAAQRQWLLSADAGLRTKGTVKRHLGEVLQRIAYDHVQDQVALVLDMEALHTLGLTPQTPLGLSAPLGPGGQRLPFWESLGLVHVPCREGALFTSRQHLEKGSEQTGFPMSGAALAEAVREAAWFGQDRSGRFRTVPNWLASGSQVPTAEKGGSLAALLPASTTGWKEWEVLAGAAEQESLVMVHQGLVGLTGWFLACLAVVASLGVRKVLPGRWNFRLWWCWTLLTGLAWLWLPPGLRGFIGPLFVAAWLVVLVLYFRPRVAWRDPLRPSKSSDKVLKAGLGVGALLASLLANPWLPALWPQAPEPYPVFLLEGPSGAPAEQMALASPDLLKRLDKLGQKSLSPQSGAFLVGAHYRGKINGQAADFQADFDVFSFSEQASLVVPLAGVDLQEGAKLGETPAYPVPLANPQTGYSLVVPGKGWQRLSLSFRVRLSPDQPELRFSIPRLAKSLLELDLPAAYQVPKVVQAQGPQKLTPAQPGQPAHLRAHLGRENTIHVRWHTEQQESPSVNPIVREAYFWDLRPPVAGLSAFFQYTVSRGSQGPVAIALPEALEVRSVEVVRLDETTPPRLRHWRVVGKKLARQLLIDLEDTSPGRFQINLFLAPRLFLGADHWHLPLPAPLKAKVIEGFLAYRLEGMEALDKWQSAAISNLASDDFARVWRAAGMRDTGSLSAAYLFRRTASRSALVLAVTVPKPLLRQELTWTVGPEGAECRAIWQLSAAQEQLLLLQGEVPQAMTVATVKGADVLRWTRSGSLLQIWLKQPRKDTVVEWTGWLPHAQKTGPGKEGLFTLPDLRMPAAKAGPVRLQVMAAPGWEIMPERLQNLQEDLAPPTSEGGIALLAGGGVYAGSFRLRSQTSTPEIHQLTCLERQQGQLVLSAFLELRLFQGKPQALTVQLRHGLGKEAKLEGPTGVQINYLGQQRGQHLWVVKLPANLPRHCSLQLTARTPWPDPTPRPVPTVRVQGATLKENWLAFLGPQLQLKESAGPPPPPVPVKELTRWSLQAQRIAEGGTLWRFSPEENDWRFVANPFNPGAPPVDILVAEQQARVGHQHHWLHQGTYWLWARAATEVQVVLPAGAQLVTASLDDQPLAARQSQLGHIILPLNEVGRLSRLRLSWAFSPTKESVEHPILSSPSFAGLTTRPVVGTLWLPPGYEAAGSLLPSLGLAHLYLQRTWAQVQLTHLLLATPPAIGDRPSAITGQPPASSLQPPASSLPRGIQEELLVCQRRFAQLARTADYYLAWAENFPGHNASTLSRLRKELAELREHNQNLIQKANLEATLKDISSASPVQDDEATAWDGANPAGSLPVYWQTTWAGFSPGLFLLPQSQDLVRQTFQASEILLLLAAAVWLLGYFPRWHVWLSWFWPEIILVLALLGLAVWGISLLGLALVIVSAGVRLYRLGRRLRTA